MSIALRLALHLPRDAATVPVVRRLLDQALRTLGVEPGCRDDVGLILTEACANVIEHALQIHDYEITIDVSGERCVIHVINAGAVVDPARLAPVPMGVSQGASSSAGSSSVAQSAAGASATTASVAGPVVPSARPAGDGVGGRGTFGDGGSGLSSASAAATVSAAAAVGAGDGHAGLGDGHDEHAGPGDGRAGDGQADPVLDEHGRGLHIIRSLADELYLTPSLSGGLVLQAVTTLRWTADAEVWQRR
ncbi:ATP-binding protein [Dactylosporangium sp. CS-047395]|uniref:ATP-binding protein n=1 Tax=Dactylosporangium sp. CS-047395 TaxID=3239936 RepID=UPI003D8DC360